MKTPKLRRLVGAVAVSALVLTACSTESGDDPEPTTDETGTDTTSTDEPTSAAADGYDLSDPNLRKAVSMAIDRQSIADVVFSGTVAPADDFWPATLAGYRGGDWCPNIQYNPEEAKRLFDESGGDRGPMTIMFNEGHSDWINAVADQLKVNLGIETIEFEELLFADMLNRLENGQAPGPHRSGWLFDYPSPGNFLGPLHGSGGSSNYTGFANDDFDAAVEAGDSKTVEDGVGDYQAAGDILCEELPIAPVYFSRLNAVFSENVAGVEFDPFESIILQNLEDLDGDGVVSQYISEPQNGLWGSVTGETSGGAVINTLFTGLYSLDKASGEIVFDGVAESIESDDEQTWTITLQDGWTFHDGTELTGQSFVDAWNWGAYAPNGADQSYFFSVPKFVGYDDVATCGTREATQEDVDAEAAGAVGDEVTDCEGSPPSSEEMTGLSADGNTITVELDAPFPQFPLVLLYSAFDPLPSDFFEAADQGPRALTAWGEAPNGNGPMMIDGEWNHNQSINTVAFPDYSGPEVAIDGYNFVIREAPEPAYLEVQAGDIDIMDTVPSAELVNVEATFGDRYISEPTSILQYIGFQVDPERVASIHGE